MSVFGGARRCTFVGMSRRRPPPLSIYPAVSLPLLSFDLTSFISSSNPLLCLMAEPLSFAASIIAVVQATQAAGQALIAIYTYYGDIKNAPENARKLTVEIKSLREILNQMKTYGEENKQSIAIQNLEENLKDCSKLLEKLQAMLYTAQKISSLKRMWRKVKQAFSKKEIADIMSQIQSYKKTFSLGLAVENMWVILVKRFG